MPQPDIPRALSAMLAHAAAHSSHYRELAWAKSLRGGASIALKNIPVTPKSALKEQTEQFFCHEVPASEGQLLKRWTSGSTGEPMEVRLTERFREINRREDARLCRGWGFERYSNVVQVRYPGTAHPPGTTTEGPYKAKFLRCLYTVDSREAFSFVRKSGAPVLYTNPQTALGILQHGADDGVQLPLRLISTISEIVPEQLRALVGTMADCRLMDKYGTIETGIIAVECSTCGAYHPSDHQTVVEVLDEGCRPVRPGKMGRVVVTPLFNRAMPLVRYETGDYAVVAKTHACPHASFSLTSICGREKNFFRLPDGTRIIPTLDPRSIIDLGLRHFKLIQRTLTDVDFLYVPRDETATLLQQKAQELVDKCMGRSFRVSCVKVSELPRTKNGKFLMHESFV